MSEWNAMTYEGKDTILRVVRREADQMFTLAEQPGAWDAPTACESWKVKDVIGHVVDTTEGYFQAFDTARAGTEAPAPTAWSACTSGQATARSPSAACRSRR